MQSPTLSPLTTVLIGAALCSRAVTVFNAQLGFTERKCTDDATSCTPYLRLFWIPPDSEITTKHTIHAITQTDNNSEGKAKGLEETGHHFIHPIRAAFLACRTTRCVFCFA